MVTVVEESLIESIQIVGKLFDHIVACVSLQCAARDFELIQLLFC